MIDYALQLGSLLGRWHQWRRAYSHERGLTRQCLDFGDSGDEEDELELLQMRSIEEAIASMPRDHQLALQHVARAECMGVEVVFNPHLLADRAKREALIRIALQELERRLLHVGVL
jgi:hypothetical protein